MLITGKLRQYWQSTSDYFSSFNSEDKAAFKSILVFGVLHLSMGYLFGLSYIRQSISFLQILIGVSMGPFLLGIAHVVGIVFMFKVVDKMVKLVSENVSVSGSAILNKAEQKQSTVNKAPELGTINSRALVKYNPYHPNVIYQRKAAGEAAEKQLGRDFSWPGANGHRGVLSTMRSIFPRLVIGATSTNSYVKLSTIVQTATFGLVRPGNLLADVPTSELGQCILTDTIGEKIEDVQAFVNVLSKSRLYDMLEQKDIRNASVLRHAISRPNPTIFKILLSAIEPHKRLYFLTKLEGVLDWKDPLVFDADTESWEIIKNTLTKSQLRTLVESTNQRGDNLLQAGTSVLRKEALSIYTIEERKELLKKCCSHGDNMLFYVARRWRLSSIKRFLSNETIPTKEWQEVLDTKPAGWSMTLGEKMMIFYHAFKKPKILKNITKAKKVKKLEEKRNFTEMTTDLKEQYGLELPEFYKNMPEKERLRRLATFAENEDSNNCDTRHRFVMKHGLLPEAILGLQEPHPLPAKISDAFGQQQRIYHPDMQRRKSAPEIKDAERISRELNAANSFLTKETERQKYQTASALKYSEEVCELAKKVFTYR